MVVVVVVVVEGGIVYLLCSRVEGRGSRVLAGGLTGRTNEWPFGGGGRGLRLWRN